MARNYIAYGWTNDDVRVEFQFESNHRANSKANKEDANRAYKKRHGHTIEITNTERSEWVDGIPTCY